MKLRQIVTMALSATLLLTSPASVSAYSGDEYLLTGETMSSPLTAVKLETPQVTASDSAEGNLKYTLSVTEDVKQVKLTFSYAYKGKALRTSFTLGDLAAGDNSCRMNADTSWKNGTYTLTSAEVTATDNTVTTLTADNSSVIAGQAFTISGGTAEPAKHTLTVVQGSASSETVLYAGDPMTLTAAAPGENRTFDGWEIPSDVTVRTGDPGKDLSVTILMPDRDLLIKASYGTKGSSSGEEPATYAFTFLNYENGTDKTERYAAGTLIPLSFTAGKGITFEGWELGTGLTLAEGALTDTSIKVKMPANDTTVRVKTSSSTSAAETPAPGEMRTLIFRYLDHTETHTHEAGTKVTVTAGEVEGYTFAGWEASPSVTPLEGTSLNADSDKLIFTMPDEETTVTASYAKNAAGNKYTLTIKNSGAGASGGGSLSAEAGASVTLTATEVKGLRFTGWTFDWEDVVYVSGSPSEQTVKVKMPARNGTATASYEADADAATYTLRYYADGEEAFAKTASLPEGGRMKLEAAAISGRAFTGWELSEGLTFADGYSGTEAVVYVVMPARDASAVAHYKEAGMPTPTPEVTSYLLVIKGVAGNGEGSAYKTGIRVKLPGQISGKELVYKTDGEDVTIETSDTGELSILMPARNVTLTSSYKEVPTAAPTETPKEEPSGTPTETPKEEPSGTPTETPKEEPSGTPTETPKEEPSGTPTETPKEEPSTTPGGETTLTPTPSGTDTPTPTTDSTGTPTPEGTATVTPEETPGGTSGNTPSPTESDPSEITPPGEGTGTPGADTPSGEETGTPGTDTPSGEETVTPKADTPSGEETITPKADTPSGEETGTPGADTPSSGETGTPGADTPSGENTETPAAETPGADTSVPTVKPTVSPSDTPKPSGAAGEGASASKASSTILNLKAGNDDPNIGTTYGALLARQSKVSKKTITLRWRKVKGAVKYIIYGNRCGQKYKKLATTKKLTWTQKKLKSGKYYKYMVMAVNSKGKVVSTSKTLHIATTGGKVGNDKSVSVTGSTTVKLKKGKTYQLKAKAVPASKSLKVKAHRGLAYESSDPTIAKVSKKGLITAKKKAGSCTIYIYAQNGLYKKIKVKVS